MEEPAEEASEPDALHDGDTLVAAERADAADVRVRERAWASPAMVARRFAASRRPCRRPCCAVGGISLPVLVVGNRAVPRRPRVLDLGRAARSTSKRPTSSTGRPESRASGDGFTPAVHTSVSAGNASPFESRITPSSADSSRVSTITSIPRSRSCSAAYVARASGAPGGSGPPRPPGPSASATRRRRGRSRARRGRGPRARRGPRRRRSRRRRTRRERSSTSRGVLLGRRDVELREHVVAEVDRLLHGLEADPALRESRYGEHAGPRAGPARPGRTRSRARRRPTRTRARRVVLHARDLAGHEPAVAEHAPERHDRRPRVDRPRRHLGQERLVLEEALLVHHRHAVARGPRRGAPSR